jgi:hypothetical protein
MLKHPVHLYIDSKSTRQILPSWRLNYPNILMRLPCYLDATPLSFMGRRNSLAAQPAFSAHFQI